MWTDIEITQVQDGISRLGWLVLKRFSAAYRPSDILAMFSCLPRRDFDTLRLVSFMLSDETNEFLTKHVPQFLRYTPSTTQHVVDERSGPPRGRVDWMRTFARRTQGGNDPTLFVTRSIDRTSDTGAARLITFLLRTIHDGARRLDNIGIPEVIRSQAQESADLSVRHAATLKGRGVRAAGRLTLKELGPLRKSRREDVTAAVRLYDLYINIIENANENLLRNLLRQRQYAPEDLDDLFEVWVLLTLVELHLSEGWDLQEASLIGGDSSPKRPKFKLTKLGSTAELFFQTVPPEMGKSSEYKIVFADYDLDPSMRRPDATIRVTSSSGEVRRIIVEVKRTQDKRYILDSVYKTFGYLSDFRSTLGPDVPLAIMVVWQGINKIVSGVSLSPVRIVTAADLPLMKLPY